MKKLLLAILLLAGTGAMAQLTAGVVASLYDVATNPQGVNASMRFTLVNCGAGNQPRLIGTNVLVRTVYDFKSINGAVAGSVYGNDQIDCGGVQNTVYKVDYFVNNVQ